MRYALQISSICKPSFYHVFNRGINKQPIFSVASDYQRFLQTLYYYQFDGPKPRFSTHHKFKVKDFSINKRIVEITCYCLMPNHFHFLLRQVKNGGIQEFVGKVSNSYTKYYNTKQRRSGPLLQGEFKAVEIESDEQLLHVSRYIHLNPFVSGLTKDLETYAHSSYLEFLGLRENQICITAPVLDFFKNGVNYKEFISDHQDYAERLERTKHLLIDES